MEPNHNLSFLWLNVSLLWNQRRPAQTEREISVRFIHSESVTTVIRGARLLSLTPVLCVLAEVGSTVCVCVTMVTLCRVFIALTHIFTAFHSYEVMVLCSCCFLSVKDSDHVVFSQTDEIS